ncbi:hypothetical protein [Lewinella sp. IMCC34191]|uniref:hypothetical protein n=1 Tax=Lewinella sp. IMCC34191 TaxID=2259172 RepID=UPI000E22D9F9|nr:hypothetical protein [Lewinella sp. IMCC34191]
MIRYLILLLLLCLASSCLPKDPSAGPVTTEIEKGARWTLRIGSGAEEVYAQLQALGVEKGFDRVAVVGRLPAREPESLGSELHLYDALTIQSTSGVTDRALLELGRDTIAKIYGGGALPDSVARWPAQVPAGDAIAVGDSISGLPEKLAALFQLSDYAGYELVLPDKPLARAYDPVMADYAEWAFVFFEPASDGLQDRYSARLLFEGGGLDLIRVTHERFEIVF